MADFRKDFRIKGICFLLSMVLFFTPIAQAYPQTVLNLPQPGVMVMPTENFVPLLVKGVKVYADDALKFDFIVDTGNTDFEQDELKKESESLIKYFLAALTVPEKDLWVNLSPYEQDKMIPDGFGKTLMGRDLLAQDYMLKQLTSSLLYPEDRVGSEFWQKVYAKANRMYGTTNIPISTFHKIWIVPDKAVVYEHEDTAFLVESRLKVMTESDYIALEKNEEADVSLEGNDKEMNDLSAEIVRKVVIPEIEREINEGKNFARLRQIYNAMILATWYKERFKDSLLGQVYVDKNKSKGVDTKDKQVNKKIYDQYVEAYKKGVYDYNRTDYDLHGGGYIERRYFSGGFSATGFASLNKKIATAMVFATTFLPSGLKDRVINSIPSIGDYETVTWRAEDRTGSDVGQIGLSSVGELKEASSPITSLRGMAGILEADGYKNLSKERRSAVISAATFIPTQNVANLLLEALSYETNPVLRNNIKSALSSLDYSKIHPNQIPKGLEALLNDGSDKVRRSAIEALSYVDSQSSLNIFFAHLPKEQNPKMREYIVDRIERSAIMPTNISEIMPTIESQLKSHSENRREAAITTLFLMPNFKSKDVANILVDAVANEKKAPLRDKMMRMLESLHRVNIKADKIPEQVIQALGSSSVARRERAIKVLIRYLGTQKAINTVFAHLPKEINKDLAKNLILPNMKIYMEWGVVPTNISEVMPVLESQLKSRLDNRRIAAVRALSFVHTQDTANLLVETLLLENSEEVRENILITLSYLKRRDVRPNIIPKQAEALLLSRSKAKRHRAILAYSTVVKNLTTLKEALSIAKIPEATFIQELRKFKMKHGNKFWAADIQHLMTINDVFSDTSEGSRYGKFMKLNIKMLDELNKAHAPKNELIIDIPESLPKGASAQLASSPILGAMKINGTFDIKKYNKLPRGKRLAMTIGVGNVMRQDSANHLAEMLVSEEDYWLQAKIVESLNSFIEQGIHPAPEFVGSILEIYAQERTYKTKELKNSRDPALHEITNLPSQRRAILTKLKVDGALPISVPEKVKNLLESRSAKKRLRAIQTMSWVRSQESANILFERLLNENNMNNIKEVSEILGNFRKNGITPTNVQRNLMVLENQTFDIKKYNKLPRGKRLAMTIGVGNVMRQDSANHLAEMLVSEEDYWLQAKIVESLNSFIEQGIHPAPEFVGSILEIYAQERTYKTKELKNSRDPALHEITNLPSQRRAILTKLKVDGALPISVPEKVKNLLESRSAKKRLRAIQTMSWVRSQESANILFERLLNENNMNNIKEVSEILGNFRKNGISPTNIPETLKALKDTLSTKKNLEATFIEQLQQFNAKHGDASWAAETQYLLELNDVLSDTSEGSRYGKFMELNMVMLDELNKAHAPKENELIIDIPESLPKGVSSPVKSLAKTIDVFDSRDYKKLRKKARAEKITALGSIQTQDSANLLVGALAQEKKYDLQESIFDTLEGLGAKGIHASPEAANVIVEALAQEKPYKESRYSGMSDFDITVTLPSMRVKALELFRSQGIVPSEVPEKVKSLLKHRSEKVRARALKSLPWVKTQKSANILYAHLMIENQPGNGNITGALEGLSILENLSGIKPNNIPEHLTALKQTLSVANISEATLLEQIQQFNPKHGNASWAADTQYLLKLNNVLKETSKDSRLAAFGKFTEELDKAHNLHRQNKQILTDIPESLPKGVSSPFKVKSPDVTVGSLDLMLESLGISSHGRGLDFKNSPGLKNAIKRLEYVRDPGFDDEGVARWAVSERMQKALEIKGVRSVDALIKRLPELAPLKGKLIEKLDFSVLEANAASSPVKSNHGESLKGSSDVIGTGWATGLKQTANDLDMQALGQPSSLIEAGHGESLKGSSDVIGTGWATGLKQTANDLDMQALGQPSSLIEAGHGESLKGSSDVIGTGWATGLKQTANDLDMQALGQPSSLIEAGHGESLKGSSDVIGTGWATGLKQTANDLDMQALGQPSSLIEAGHGESLEGASSPLAVKKTPPKKLSTEILEIAEAIESRGIVIIPFSDPEKFMKAAQKNGITSPGFAFIPSIEESNLYVYNAVDSLPALKQELLRQGQKIFDYHGMNLKGAIASAQSWSLYNAEIKSMGASPVILEDITRIGHELQGQGVRITGFNKPNAFYAEVEKRGLEADGYVAVDLEQSSLLVLDAPHDITGMAKNIKMAGQQIIDYHSQLDKEMSSPFEARQQIRVPGGLEALDVGARSRIKTIIAKNKKMDIDVSLKNTVWLGEEAVIINVTGKTAAEEFQANKALGEVRYEIASSIPKRVGNLSSPIGAKSSTRGGVDLGRTKKQLQIRRDKNGKAFPAIQQPIESIRLEGLTAVVVGISPTPKDLPIFTTMAAIQVSK